MPKVELHVHLEGSIRPEALLELARRNDIPLPVDKVEELPEWYVFMDFPHFAEVYQTLSRCIGTQDNIGHITRDFFRGRAAPNVLHSDERRARPSPRAREVCYDAGGRRTTCPATRAPRGPAITIRSSPS